MIKRLSRHTPLLLVLLGTSLLIGGIAAWIVVRDFRSPLSHPEGGDTDFWDYMGYYFYKNLTLYQEGHWLPSVQWVSTQHLYPFGTSHVFQGWAVESCLWYAACYSHWDAWGNWLGYYYVAATVVTFLGSFLILHKDIGQHRALIISVLVSCFNFYALHRYPEHFSHTIHHWVTLSILADYVLYRRYWLQQFISIRFILIKGVLLVLSLGLEVGYVSGYALASFALIVLFAVIHQVAFRKIHPLQAVARKMPDYKAEWQQNGFSIFCLITVFGVISWLYAGIMWRIVTEVANYPGSSQVGSWWVNPLRILTPFFTVPDSSFGRSFFGDYTEGMAQGVIGWFLGGMAIWGYIRATSQERWFLLPFLILGLLCLTYHPVRFPTLKLFPWFMYNRVPGRATIIYPTLAALFSMAAWQLPKTTWQQMLIGTLVAIGGYEWWVNYSFKYKATHYKPAANFYDTMLAIRQSPGEAVFDFPFCVIGGNGVGEAENLAPLYASNANVSTMQRFHQKSTIGHYYGRLTEAQLKPLLAHGWGNLMQTASKAPFQKQRLSNCLTTQQFAELTSFVERNNFCGINLYTELLPNTDCTNRFYAYFGTPTYETVVPGSGKMVFIPKRKLNPGIVKPGVSQITFSPNN